MKNDGLRHEIFGDVLSSHLDMKVSLAKDERAVKFTRGYFLGRHEVRWEIYDKFSVLFIKFSQQLKFEILEQLKPMMETPNTLKVDGLTVKFCGKNVDPPAADANCLPVMMHTCPDDFSTLDYFDVRFTWKKFTKIHWKLVFAVAENGTCWTTAGLLESSRKLIGSGEQSQVRSWLRCDCKRVDSCNRSWKQPGN